MQFKTWLNIREGLDFEDMFDSSRPHPKIVTVGEPRQEPYLLELYRGFDVDVNNLQRRGQQHFVLSPEKSDQKLIWFTHKLINVYDPIDYVRGRGNKLLVYPLKCIRHLQDVVWSNGNKSTKTPDEILARTKSTENSRYYMGVELPEGWVFSYKHEKFIGCSIEIEITLDMLYDNGPRLDSNKK